MPRIPNSRNGSRRRREREVLEAAVEVFARRGYVAASVQDVADAVGILKGSLYHYITSKDELLFRVLSEVHDDVEAILDEVRDVPGLSARERLSLYVERQIAYNLTHLARISIYYHDAGHLSDAHRSEIYARRKVHERFVADLVQQAQADGDADPSLDPRVAANCVFGTIIWVYRWGRPDRTDAAQLASTCAEFAIGGLAGTRA